MNGSLTDDIETRDCNFDGYPDIMIFCQDGAAGPNNTYNFYIYNPGKGLFEFNENLSALSQVNSDPEKQMITSAFRNGAAGYSEESYRFIHGKLTKTAYWNQDYKNALFFDFSNAELVNGQWTVAERKFYGRFCYRGGGKSIFGTQRATACKYSIKG